MKEGLYNDAVLYNAAKKRGVKVIGLEGANLQASKDSPEEYNKAREDYMASRITQITSKGYNVIAYVGFDHVDNLKEAIVMKSRARVENNSSDLSQELKEKARMIGEKARVHILDQPISPGTQRIPLLKPPDIGIGKGM